MSQFDGDIFPDDLSCVKGTKKSNQHRATYQKLWSMMENVVVPPPIQRETQILEVLLCSTLLVSYSLDDPN